MYNLQLLQAMSNQQLEPYFNEQLIFDGKLHRYRVSGDKPGTKNGWYIAYETYLHNTQPFIYAVFGSWKIDGKQIWHSSKEARLDRGQYALIKKQINDAKAQLLARKYEEQKQVANLVFNLWNSMPAASPTHPYLVKKKIDAFCARQSGNQLVLPIIDCDQKLWSLQHIGPDDKKMQFAGGAKKGNFIPINGCITQDLILIGEGFSTCATLAMHYPSACVIAAIDAGNLPLVAVSIRKNNLQAEIIICGDDDRLTVGNPGATKAYEAAVAANAKLILPQWTQDAPQNLTDFNDYFNWIGGVQ